MNPNPGLSNKVNLVNPEKKSVEDPVMAAILKCSEGVQVRIPPENPTNIDRKPEIVPKALM